MRGGLPVRSSRRSSYSQYVPCLTATEMGRKGTIPEPRLSIFYPKQKTQPKPVEILDKRSQDDRRGIVKVGMTT